MRPRWAKALLCIAEMREAGWRFVSVEEGTFYGCHEIILRFEKDEVMNDAAT